MARPDTPAGPPRGQEKAHRRPPGSATPVLILSPSAHSSSSGLTYQDIAPAANHVDRPNPFALEGQAKRAADQAALVLARQRQPALAAPAPVPYGFPPSVFSRQQLGAPAAPGPTSSSTFLPLSRHPSLVSLGDSASGAVAPRSINRQQRELLHALRSDHGGGSSAGSAAGKENVEPVRRRPFLGAPTPTAAPGLEPPTPKRQRIRVAEWRDQVHRAASVEEGTSGGDGASRVDGRAPRQGAAAVGAGATRPVGKEQEGRTPQAQPGRTVVGRQQGKPAQEEEGEDGERAQPLKKARQRRQPAAKDDQPARSSPSSGGGGRGGPDVSAPKRRSGRTKRASGPVPTTAAANETGVSTLDLVAMLPRRAKRFGRRGGLSSQDEGEEEDEEDEATDYDDPGPTSKRKAKQRKPATRSRKTVGKAPSGRTRKRDEASGESDNSAARRKKKEAARLKWAEIDAFPLEVVPTL
ncbi:hypothetical protein JCM8208_000196 [Rhodotorula glutinis]